MKIWRIDVDLTPYTTYLVLAESEERAIELIQLQYRVPIDEDYQVIKIIEDLDERGIIYQSL